MRKLLLAALFLASWPAMAEDHSGLEASLKGFFAKGVYWQGAKAELDEVVRWPEAEGALRWSLPNMRGYPDRISLIGEQKTDNGMRRWYVPVRLHWLAKAVVVSRDLPSGTVLSEPLMQVKLSDIAGLQDAPWTDPKALVGARLLRNIRADQVLSSRLISQPLAIQRGDQVMIIVKFNGLEVRAEGKALQKAALGEKLRVQNLRSKSILQARALDAHTVEVFAGGEG